jgi:hypothetical protein
LKRDKANLIAPLVSITEQRQNSGFCCSHTLFRSHTPACIDHKAYSIAGFSNAHLLSKVAALEMYAPLLSSRCLCILAPLALKWRCLTKSCIKRQIGYTVGATAGDVPAFFAIGSCTTTFTSSAPLYAIALAF